MLELLGLDTLAVRVYQLLVSGPVSGIAEICTRLEMSEGDARAALDELVDLRLVRESREHPGTMCAVDPRLGLELMLRRQEEQLARQQQELAASRKAAAEAIADFAGAPHEQATDSTRKLLGLDAVQGELDLLLHEVSSELLTVTPGGAVSADVLDLARAGDERMLARGVSIKVLYHESVRNDSATRAYAQWITDLGGHVRTAPMLPPRLLIFDRRTLLTPIDPGNTRLGAIRTSEPGIVSSLIALHERCWEQACPFGSAPVANADTGLLPVEQDLLKLLAAGLTDESSAARLGLSRSTVRRLVAGMMERLGARSRFELGQKAAQRGWV